jgi:hypothetical protein
MCKMLYFGGGIIYIENSKVTPNSVALSLQANYTDWATANSQRNLVSTFVDRGVSRDHHGRSPTVVNLSFLDRIFKNSATKSLVDSYQWYYTQIKYYRSSLIFVPFSEKNKSVTFLIFYKSLYFLSQSTRECLKYIYMEPWEYRALQRVSAVGW